MINSKVRHVSRETKEQEELIEKVVDGKRGMVLTNYPQMEIPHQPGQDILFRGYGTQEYKTVTNVVYTHVEDTNDEIIKNNRMLQKERNVKMAKKIRTGNPYYLNEIRHFISLKLKKYRNGWVLLAQKYGYKIRK